MYAISLNATDDGIDVCNIEILHGIYYLAVHLLKYFLVFSLLFFPELVHEEKISVHLLAAAH